MTPLSSQTIAQGDRVQPTGSPGIVGVVTALYDGDATVCFPIGGSYQLRGPIPVDQLERVR